MKIDEVLKKLNGVRKASNGNYIACCPAHDDKQQSLAIKFDDKTGKLLFRCFAGCDYQSIAEAIGSTNEKKKPDDIPPRLIETYSYHDENGKVLYKKLKYLKPGGGKFFNFVSEAGNTKGDHRVLYNLPGVVKAIESGDPVYWVEGEKDVETLRAIGYTATTKGGASDFPAENDIELLSRASRVYVLADNDEVGIRLAEFVANSLKNSVRLHLPGVADKEDVTDWLQSHSVEEFASLIKPQYWVWAADIDYSSLTEEWIIEGYLPEGARIIEFFGAAKSGKTTAVIDMVCSIAAGKPWAGHRTERAAVFYIASESLTEIKKRVVAWSLLNNVQLDCNFTLAIRERPVMADKRENVEALARDIETLNVAQKPIVVVLDTVARSMSQGSDENGDGLRDLASNMFDCISSPYGATVICVHHSGHMNTERSRGSSAFSAALDGSFQVKRNEDLITVTSTMSRYGSSFKPHSFRIAQVEIPMTENRYGKCAIGSVATYIAEEDIINPPTKERKSNDAEFYSSLVERHGENEAKRLFKEELISRGLNDETVRKRIYRLKKSFLNS